MKRKRKERNPWREAFRHYNPRNPHFEGAAERGRREILAAMANDR